MLTPGTVAGQDHRVGLRTRGGHHDELGCGRRAERHAAGEQRDHRGRRATSPGKPALTAAGGGLRAHLAQGWAQDQVVVRWSVE
jgi:hypothetical protein